MLFRSALPRKSCQSRLPRLPPSQKSSKKASKKTSKSHLGRLEGRCSLASLFSWLEVAWLEIGRLEIMCLETVWLWLCDSRGGEQ